MERGTANDAVTRALGWLVRQQSEDGRWAAGGPESRLRPDALDTGLTGLALLCFLGAGETHQAGNHKETVKEALKYLRSVQRADGCLTGDPAGTVSAHHLAAALALVESYGMTQSVIFKDSAQRAAQYVVACRNDDGGWSATGRGGTSDVPTTAWAVLCLKSAELAELQLPHDALAGTRAWLDLATDARTGAVRDRLPTGSARGDVVESLASTHDAAVAAAAVARILCGTRPEDDPRVLAGVESILDRAALPGARAPDPGAAYFGTLAMFLGDDVRWARWRDAVREPLVIRQRTGGDDAAAGSWDPRGDEASHAARLAATCVHALDLETSYRYRPVRGR